MNSSVNKPELLIPAGSLDVLKVALDYGADAVYVGGEMFSLRAGARNFTHDDLVEASRLVHERGKKLYITANITAHEYDLKGVREYFEELKEVKPDALIVSDPGIMSIQREILPDIPIHVSTQANNVNSADFRFWHDAVGATRVVGGRELSLNEIKRIRSEIPDDLEIEAFVHGAMCISYSGRCLLSNYIDGRDSNRGECVQPCRWNYELEGGRVYHANFREKGKGGEWFTVEEDGRGSFLLNSRDMCLAPYLREIEEAGVSCIKIEGRMKSILYVATAVNAYRMALDGAPIEVVMRELMRLSHRPYTTGFAFRESEKCRGGTYGKERSLNILYGENPGELMEYETGGYAQEAQISAVVIAYDEQKREALIEQRNNFKLGDTLGILAPSMIWALFSIFPAIIALIMWGLLYIYPIRK